MKSVMAGSARKISQRWWRVRSLKSACQRRGGIAIMVFGGYWRLSVSLLDKRGGVIADASDFGERRGSQLELGRTKR